jgi:hypothetical protein
MDVKLDQEITCGSREAGVCFLVVTCMNGRLGVTNHLIFCHDTTLVTNPYYYALGLSRRVAMIGESIYLYDIRH